MIVTIINIKEHLPKNIKATFIETATIANGKKL
jgi:hypothetical protein